MHRIACWAFAGVVALGVGSSACAKARAETVPDGPPLQVPEPPPRVVAPVEEAVIAAPAPAPPPPAAAAPRTPSRRASEPRTQAPPPTPIPPAPAERELRAAPSPTNAATDQMVRNLLARASRDLNRVNYARLGAEGRATYDQSKRFGERAEQALKEGNVVFAATLADKAASLAAELPGR